MPADPPTSSSPDDALENWIRRVAPHSIAHREFVSSGQALPQPGDRIGEFELLHLLGAGGMGQVWEAKQESLQRHVALKLVHAERLNEKTLALFAREARAGGKLSHSGIVAVYSHGHEGERPWIAQELVKGSRTLRDFIEDMRGLSELPGDYYQGTARLIIAIADALQAAHAAGVIHRDIKPRNILLSEAGQPKVTDFGLAKISEEISHSKTGEVAGTWLYMSPEQVLAQRGQVDHRTDIFSLGVVMYELLALRRPFEGDTSHQIAQNILQLDPPELRVIRSRIPSDLAVICGKALEKRREERYATMMDFAEDLRRFTRSEPILAKPPTWFERAQKWTRRHPTKSVAAALVTVGLFVIIGLLVEISRQNIVLASNEGELRSRSEDLEESLVEVSRLSLSANYERLINEVSGLWPIHPDKINAYDDWIERAQALVNQLPGLHEQLKAIRALALPRSEALSDPMSRQGTWRFPEPKEGELSALWWHSQLTELITDIESLVIPETGLLSPNGVHPEYGWSIPRRLGSAEGQEIQMLPKGEHRVRWEVTRREMASESSAPILTPMAGLVPIGRDPQSMLWEFWHAESGSEPIRNEDGELQIEEGSGLVFVLLPGGHFWMGAQAEDPGGQNYDSEVVSSEAEGPVHPVELSAFLLSKFEMTQGQWNRLTGEVPSMYNPEVEGDLLGIDWTHPVEQVSWYDCMKVLRRLGMTLPSEAQWEYAARGDTETPWWSGADKLNLQGVANIADVTARDNGGGLWPGIQDWLTDGFIVHGPVGHSEPNPFGLHEVHGNLWEWCLDGWRHTPYPVELQRDPVVNDRDYESRAYRGGSFNQSHFFSRSSFRIANGATTADITLGLRPAILISE